ncbi:MAG: hypothetical protein EOP06_24320 [Proteobacteria bacterium]|nr:MAG: hypothetical protein EOP06_24320 [Pseudomonadota bacterium]
MRWKLKGTLPKPFSDSGHEMWFPQKTNCKVLDALTGKIKRYTASPRQSDGNILRVTSDYIYTQNGTGEIFRWRAP